MAGGTGSRLYPISTPERPKQFLDLLSCGKTMIQLTYERFLKINPELKFWVVTNAEYVHFIREQLPDIPAEQILAEPAARSTAPCIAYACWKIRKRWADANICVTPADAYVPDADAFAATIRQALDYTAVNNSIVCLGIKPDSPHTGYGYINADGVGISKVISFKEKPDLETAKSYLERGGYFWNAGIFVWNAETLCAQIEKFAPQIAGKMEEMKDSFYTDEEVSCVQRIFPECEKISIDYAVMEKSPDVQMIAANWEWSDLGSIPALEKILQKKV